MPTIYSLFELLVIVCIMNNMQNIFITEKYDDYELLDSGEGQKLERFGDVRISRPDP